MDAFNTDVPIEQTFGSAHLVIWPDGIDNNGRPFGLIRVPEHVPGPLPSP
jgi:hypothetical protein